MVENRSSKVIVPEQLNGEELIKFQSLLNTYGGERALRLLDLFFELTNPVSVRLAVPNVPYEWPKFATLDKIYREPNAIIGTDLTTNLGFQPTYKIRVPVEDGDQWGPAAYSPARVEFETHKYYDDFPSLEIRFGKKGGTIELNRVSVLTHEFEFEDDGSASGITGFDDYQEYSDYLEKLHGRAIDILGFPLTPIQHSLPLALTL